MSMPGGGWPRRAGFRLRHPVERFAADRPQSPKTADRSRRPEILKPAPIGHFVEFSLRAAMANALPSALWQVRQPALDLSGSAVDFGPNLSWQDVHPPFCRSMCLAWRKVVAPCFDGNTIFSGSFLS